MGNKGSKDSAQLASFRSTDAKLQKYEASIHKELKRWQTIPAKRVAEIDRAREASRTRISLIHSWGLDDLMDLFVQHATLVMKREYLHYAIDGAAVEYLATRLKETRAIRLMISTAIADARLHPVESVANTALAVGNESNAPPNTGEHADSLHDIALALCVPGSGSVEAYTSDPSQAVAAHVPIARLQRRVARVRAQATQLEVIQAALKARLACGTRIERRGLLTALIAAEADSELREASALEEQAAALTAMSSAIEKLDLVLRTACRDAVSTISTPGDDMDGTGLSDLPACEAEDAVNLRTHLVKHDEIIALHPAASSMLTLLSSVCTSDPHTGHSPEVPTHDAAAGEQPSRSRCRPHVPTGWLASMAPLARSLFANVSDSNHGVRPEKSSTTISVGVASAESAASRIIPSSALASLLLYVCCGRLLRPAAAATILSEVFKAHTARLLQRPTGSATNPASAATAVDVWSAAPVAAAVSEVLAAVGRLLRWLQQSLQEHARATVRTHFMRSLLCDVRAPEGRLLCRWSVLVMCPLDKPPGGGFAAAGGVRGALASFDPGWEWGVSVANALGVACAHASITLAQVGLPSGVDLLGGTGGVGSGVRAVPVVVSRASAAYPAGRKPQASTATPPVKAASPVTPPVGIAPPSRSVSIFLRHYVADVVQMLGLGAGFELSQADMQATLQRAEAGLLKCAIERVRDALAGGSTHGADALDGAAAAATAPGFALDTRVSAATSTATDASIALFPVIAPEANLPALAVPAPATRTAFTGNEVRRLLLICVNRIVSPALLSIVRDGPLLGDPADTPSTAVPGAGGLPLGSTAEIMARRDVFWSRKRAAVSRVPLTAMDVDPPYVSTTLPCDRLEAAAAAYERRMLGPIATDASVVSQAPAPAADSIALYRVATQLLDIMEGQGQPEELMSTLTAALFAIVSEAAARGDAAAAIVWSAKVESARAKLLQLTTLSSDVPPSLHSEQPAVTDTVATPATGVCVSSEASQPDTSLESIDTLDTCDAPPSETTVSTASADERVRLQECLASLLKEGPEQSAISADVLAPLCKLACSRAHAWVRPHATLHALATYAVSEADKGGRKDNVLVTMQFGVSLVCTHATPPAAPPPKEQQKQQHQPTAPLPQTHTSTADAVVQEDFPMYVLLARQSTVAGGEDVADGGSFSDSDVEESCEASQGEAVATIFEATAVGAVSAETGDAAEYIALANDVQLEMPGDSARWLPRLQHPQDASSPLTVDARTQDIINSAASPLSVGRQCSSVAVHAGDSEQAASPTRFIITDGLSFQHGASDSANTADASADEDAEYLALLMAAEGMGGDVTSSPVSAAAGRSGGGADDGLAALRLLLRDQDAIEGALSIFG